MQRVKGLVIVMGLVLSTALSARAGGGGSGNYEWKVSFSASSPDSQTSPALTAPTSVYLWFTGCNTAPAGAGMAVGEFNIKLTGWTQFGFSPLNGYLNAGNATELLLAVGGCPAGPVAAGFWTVFGASGKIGLIPGTVAGTANTIDCNQVTPELSIWPGQVRLAGCGTVDFAATLQDHGNGCTGDPVNPTTWGGVKALYR